MQKSVRRCRFLLAGTAAQLLAAQPAWAQSPTARSTENPAAAAGELRSTTPRPHIELLSLTVNKDGSITVEAQVEDPAGGEVELAILQDGEPVKALTVAQGRDLATASRYTLQIRPPHKDGVLSIVARSGSTSSQPLTLRLRKGVPERRPALYVLAIGVGRYQSTDIPSLRFAAKDAKDLATTLQKQRDMLYREISTRVLTDGQAIRSQVMEGLHWLTTQVGKDDTAVVFLAGHGTNDPDGMYYFLPTDAQADRATMLSGSELQDALRQIPGRVVLMLDTCHSGNVLGKRSLNRFINDLTSENRIVVFAASTGDQVARESSDWNNGVFTKALVEGLRGVADYAEDSKITVSELETWTSVRVSQLTAGAQTPTLAKPNAVPDYTVAALPEQGVLPNPKQAVRRRLLWGAGGVSLGLAVGIGLAVGLSLTISGSQNVLEPRF